MAKLEAHSRIVDSLSQSSPLLSETAALLGQTSLLTVGLPITDAANEKPSAGRFRVEGADIADAVTRQAAIVSQAAPDLALAAPDTALAAAA